MINPPLLLVSALFFLALASALYVGAWLVATVWLRAGRGRISPARTKRILMGALALPPALALLPTVSGATLRHLHETITDPHHSPGCHVVFTRIAVLTGAGEGTAASVLVNGAAWLLVGVGALLLLRLVRATLRLERGIGAYLEPPSPRLLESLARVGQRFPRLPAGRFFECAIPPNCSSVLGFRRARCVLSRAFVAGAADEELDAVVAHEAAHLRGSDVAATFLVGALNCLFFFLRPVRLLSRRWREATELACDDAAVAATGEPLAMAAAILKVSETPVQTPLPAVALPFADQVACAPARRVERLLVQAQRAAPANNNGAESRAQIALGWLATLLLAGFGTALLLSAEAACFAHCTLEAIARFL